VILVIPHVDVDFLRLNVELVIAHNSSKLRNNDIHIHNIYHKGTARDFQQRKTSGGLLDG
jgi:hypothetical protein